MRCQLRFGPQKKNVEVNNRAKKETETTEKDRAARHMLERVIREAASKYANVDAILEATRCRETA